MILCDYCGKPAHLVDSGIVYGGISYGWIWYCPDCQAWVGVHKGTKQPKGRLANAELRGWKRGAHAAFDPLWRGKKRTRRQAYRWLSRQMGLPEEKTHIGKFDVDQCKQVIRICQEARNHEEKRLSPSAPAAPGAEAHAEDRHG